MHVYITIKTLILEHQKCSIQHQNSKNIEQNQRPCSAGHQCRCQHKLSGTVRHFFVVGTSPSWEFLLTMHPPPHFSMAPKWVQSNVLWTYWSLVYWGCSSCPQIIKMLSLLPQNHCCVQPHTSLLAGYCIGQNYSSIFFSSDVSILLRVILQFS